MIKNISGKRTYEFLSICENTPNAKAQKQDTTGREIAAFGDPYIAS
jgi:hypothetical protein